MTHRPASIANAAPDNSSPGPSTAPGQLIVFTGPSGVGKGTLLRALLENHPELHLSVSATTRPPRSGEVHGQDYYFVAREDFEQMIRQGDLLEWAEFAGNYYGTPVQSVMAPVQAGHWVVLEIELEGARQIRQRFPGALQIFILPPSLEALEQRIRRRGQDDETAITRRLQRAQVEIEAAAEFDIQIINDDLGAALEQLESCLFERLQATQP